MLGTWAGLRPLVRDARSERTADLSRRHSVQRSPGGLITVTGGKLTTYRRMAADAVDAVARGLDDNRRHSRTKHLRLVGGEEFDPAAVSTGAEPSIHAHLAGRYDTEAGAVLALVDDDPELGAPLVPGLPYLRAEAVFAARHEMAHTLDDVLARRTRARLLARDATAAAADDIASLLAPELGWSAADCARNAAAYRASVAAEREHTLLQSVP